jgi:hypothetical protein
VVRSLRRARHPSARSAGQTRWHAGKSSSDRSPAWRSAAAIHSFPLPERDDEFYLTGSSVLREDPSLEQSVRASFLATGGGSDGSERLFEFMIERALLSTYKKRGEPDSWPPRYEKWRDAVR